MCQPVSPAGERDRPEACRRSAQPPGAHDAGGRGRDRDAEQAQPDHAELGEQLELDAVRVLDLEGRGFALDQEAVRKAAGAIAEQRVVARVVKRHPPGLASVRARVEGEAAGLGGEVRRALLAELVDAVADPVHRVADGGDERDRDQRDDGREALRDAPVRAVRRRAEAGQPGLVAGSRQRRGPRRPPPSAAPRAPPGSSRRPRRRGRRRRRCRARGQRERTRSRAPWRVRAN